MNKIEKEVKLELSFAERKFFSSFIRAPKGDGRAINWINKKITEAYHRGLKDKADEFKVDYAAP